MNPNPNPIVSKREKASKGHFERGGIVLVSSKLLANWRNYDVRGGSG